MRKRVAFAQEQIAELRLADAGRILQHGLEHRLQVAGRAGDDLQHLGGRGLLLQRFGEIVGALAQFVEQPRVLDGDDGLGGEVLHQLDLLVGERAHLLAVDHDGADQLVVLEHRHDQRRSRAAELDVGAPTAIAFEIALVGAISAMCDGVSASMHAAERMCAGAVTDRAALRQQFATARRVRRRTASRERVAVVAANSDAELGVADARRVFQHGLEHRLQLARRAGDDLEHLRRSRSAAPAIR